MQGNDKARTDHSFTSFHQQAAFAFLITPEVLGKLTEGGAGGEEEGEEEEEGEIFFRKKRLNKSQTFPQTFLKKKLGRRCAIGKIS